VTHIGAAVVARLAGRTCAKLVQHHHLKAWLCPALGEEHDYYGHLAGGSRLPASSVSLAGHQQVAKCCLGSGDRQVRPDRQGYAASEGWLHPMLG
jgi:hypothetical protein